MLADFLFLPKMIEAKHQILINVFDDPEILSKLIRKLFTSLAYFQAKLTQDKGTTPYKGIGVIHSTCGTADNYHK